MSGLVTQDDAAGESQREYFISHRRIILGYRLRTGAPVRASIWKQVRMWQAGPRPDTRCELPRRPAKEMS